MINGYTYSANNVNYNGNNDTLIGNSSCTRASSGYSGSSGSFIGASVTYKCNNTNTNSNTIPATINATGCFAPCLININNATASSSFTLNSGAIVWLHGTTATCNAGYISSSGANPICNNGTWSGSCVLLEW